MARWSRGTLFSWGFLNSAYFARLEWRWELIACSTSKKELSARECVQQLLLKPVEFETKEDVLNDLREQIRRGAFARNTEPTP